MMQDGNNGSREPRTGRRFGTRALVGVLVGGLVIALLGVVAILARVPSSPAPSDAPPGEKVGLAIGNLAPDFSAATDVGGTVQLSALRGRVVILNFWATWCGPCVIEMPGLERTYQQREKDGFVVLAINNRETIQDIAPFRERFGLTFPILLDESGAIQNQFAINQYPSSLILDKNGVIVARHLGVLTPKQINEFLSSLLP